MSMASKHCRDGRGNIIFFSSSAQFFRNLRIFQTAQRAILVVDNSVEAECTGNILYS